MKKSTKWTLIGFGIFIAVIIVGFFGSAVIMGIIKSIDGTEEEIKEVTNVEEDVMEEFITEPEEINETEEAEESEKESFEEVTDEEEEEKPSFTSDDGKIEFTLDNVERVKVLPDEIVKITGAQQVRDTSKEGYDFIVIYLEITHIKDGHISFTSISSVTSAFQPAKENTAIFTDNSNLVDNSGAEFINCFVTVQGVEFNDLTNLTSSAELCKGSKMTVIFEIPENSQPVKLKLAYTFFKSWSKSGQYQSEEERHIDIILY